jgi:carbon-monoxide dehydrogenase large subunit
MKLDRGELRARNLIPPEKMPYESPLKARSGAPILYDSGDYPATQAEMLGRAQWDDFPRRQKEARQAGRYLGIGLAHGLKGTGRGPFEMALVRVSGTGRVSVLTGASAMGQGLATALAQICAQELGMRPEEVTVVAGDSSVVPVGLGGFASRQTVTAGSSVMLAARAVGDKAKALAGMLMQRSTDDLELADGVVRMKDSPERVMSLGELARALRGGPGYGFPPGFDPGLEASAAFRIDQLAYANACHVAEVEVDPDTGVVEVVRYTTVDDCGRAVNPMILHGQTHGGIAQGVGQALWEHSNYDPQSGQLLAGSMMDYAMPRAHMMPSFTTELSETLAPGNPLGVRGGGEGGTTPALGVVVNAVVDALSDYGVTHIEMPVTAERVWRAIRQGKIQAA